MEVEDVYNWLQRVEKSDTDRKSLAEWIATLAKDVARIDAAENPPKAARAFFVRGGCCGFAEIDNLAKADTPIASFRELFPRPQLYGTPVFVFFTQSRVESQASAYYGHLGLKNRAYGQEFADFLAMNALGEVTYQGERLNSRTGRLVAGWLWKPDVPVLKTFLEKLAKEDNLAREAWRGQIEAAGRQSSGSQQVANGGETIQPSSENGSGIGGGVVETPDGG